MRVAIATVQVPYLSGGAEALAEGLRAAIARQGHPVEIITLPFRFFPPQEIERAMDVWEGENFLRLNMYEPERVICLKFPAYGLEHPSKALWLCHQHRSSYELFDAKRASPEEHALKDAVAAFDRKHLAGMWPRCTISKRVSERLMQSCALDSTPLYHPPPMAGRHYSAEREPFVFFPSRVESAKRQELLVRAMGLVPEGLYAVFAGEGGQIGAMRELTEKLGLAHRVRFVGRVSDEEMLAYYAHCAAVFFGPLDEDYGYVTLEAMLSERPVITCTDSGGPLEFVVDGETGLVTEPTPKAVADALAKLGSDPGFARRLGEAGKARYGELVKGWDPVVDALLAKRT